MSINVKEIGNAIKNSSGKAVFFLKRHSPEILMIFGLGCNVGGTVAACVATKKAIPIIKKRDLDLLDCLDKHSEKTKYVEDVDDIKEYRKEVRMIKANAAVNVSKNFIFPVALEAVGIASILGGYKIINQRNVALVAAYSTIANGFKNYRNNVVNTYGKEVDERMMYGVFEEKSNDIPSSTDLVEETKFSIDEKVSYSRFFDETCRYWDKDMGPLYNLSFIKKCQSLANDMLWARGYLFLYEVYDLLGIQRTKASYVVGWVIDPKSNVPHDNYVDFGLYNDYNDKNKSAFIKGENPSVLLEFNVMGPILNELKLEDY